MFGNEWDDYLQALNVERQLRYQLDDCFLVSTNNPPHDSHDRRRISGEVL